MQVVLSIRKGQRQTLMNLTFAWTSNCANRDSFQTECAVTLQLLPFHFRWYRSVVFLPIWQQSCESAPILSNGCWINNENHIRKQPQWPWEMERSGNMQYVQAFFFSFLFSFPVFFLTERWHFSLPLCFCNFH